MSDLLISSDSHVLEPSDLWTKGLPESMRSRAPRVFFNEQRGVSMWNIDNAVAELRRCKDAGLCGAMIWERPPESHSFKNLENDPFWAAAAEMDMPVALHILTDHGITQWRVEQSPTGVDRYKATV